MSSKDNLDDYDEKYKIMVLGEATVGKTSLINRYTNDKFGGRYLCTVGIDFQRKKIEKNNKQIVLQIWDTAGQERFRNVTKNYFQKSHGFILAYDITNRESFEKIRFWIEQIKANAEDKVQSILIGTKVDLENESRNVDYEDGKELADSNGFKFFETSAKNDINIKETFDSLVGDIMENFEENEYVRQSIQIKKKDHNNRKNNNKDKEKKGCC